MIDYAVLCQAIADWRAGHAPTPAQYAVDPQPESADEYEEYVEEEAAPSEEHTVIYNLPLEPLDDE